MLVPWVVGSTTTVRLLPRTRFPIGYRYGLATAVNVTVAE
jgi:hypothetical protein